MRSLLVAALTAGVSSSSASAQSIVDRLNLDKLRLVSLGGSVGRILPSQVLPTTLFALQADYGEITPKWHVVFGVSYWESRFRDAVIQTFVDSLQKSLSDTTARVLPSHVTLYDIAFGADLRYTPTSNAVLQPFLGLGVAAHVLNAEGKLIRGTFVERTLDNIAGGFYVALGASLRVVNHLGIEASARGDLLSGFRSSQARAGLTYYFGHVRGGGSSAASGGREASRESVRTP